LDPVGSGQGPVVGSCEYGNEPLGSGATELVSWNLVSLPILNFLTICFKVSLSFSLASITFTLALSSSITLFFETMAIQHGSTYCNSFQDFEIERAQVTVRLHPVMNLAVGFSTESIPALLPRTKVGLAVQYF
jgi:hypothetical protein